MPIREEPNHSQQQAMVETRKVVLNDAKQEARFVFVWPTTLLLTNKNKKKKKLPSVQNKKDPPTSPVMVCLSVCLRHIMGVARIFIQPRPSSFIITRLTLSSSSSSSKI
eukprot:scaffold2657_cov89-Amphora_coffeaeformis.AAC.4